MSSINNNLKRVGSKDFIIEKKNLIRTNIYKTDKTEISSVKELNNENHSKRNNKILFK